MTGRQITSHLVTKYEFPNSIENSKGASHFYTTARIDGCANREICGNYLFGATGIPCHYTITNGRVDGYPKPALQDLLNCRKIYEKAGAPAEQINIFDFHFNVRCFIDLAGSKNVFLCDKQHGAVLVRDFSVICNNMDYALGVYRKHVIFLMQVHMLRFFESIYGPIPLQKFFMMYFPDVIALYKDITEQGAFRLLEKVVLRKAPLEAMSAAEVVQKIADKTPHLYQSAETGEFEQDDSFSFQTSLDRLVALHEMQNSELAGAAAEKKIQEENDAAAVARMNMHLFGISSLSTDNDDDNNNNSNNTHARVVHPTDGFVMASTNPKDVLVQEFDTRTISVTEWVSLLVFDIYEKAYRNKKHLYLYVEDVCEMAMDRKLPYPFETSDIISGIASLSVKHSIFVINDGVDQGRGTRLFSTQAEARQAIMLSLGERKYRITRTTVFDSEKTNFRRLHHLVNTEADGAVESYGSKERGIDAVTEFARMNGRPLNEQQSVALRNFAQRRVNCLCGKGGTGKTYMMGLFALYGRLMDGNDAKFLFTGFTNSCVNTLKNGVMSVMRSASSEFSFVMDGSNCEFITLDFLMQRLLSRASQPAPSADGEQVKPTFYSRIFVDEAAMACLRNFTALFKAGNAQLTSLLMCGDENQLEPIDPGSCFYDITKHLPSTVTKLTKLERTRRVRLSIAMDFVLEGNYDYLLRLCSDDYDEDQEDQEEEEEEEKGTRYKDDSFGIQFAYSDSCWFSSDASLRETITCCWSTLASFDPNRTKYKQTQMICPFRSHVYLLNLVCDAYYGKRVRQLDESKFPEWVSAASAFAKGDSLPSVTVFSVGSKVVFRETNKNDKFGRVDNRYCKGQIGFVTSIFDVPSTTHSSDYSTTAAKKQQESTAAEIAFSCKRVVEIDGCYALDVYSSSHLTTLFESANALTVDKMQGNECENVLCFFPYSKNVLNERTRMYTAISRAKDKCIVVTCPNQLRIGMLNERKIANSNLSIWLSKYQQ